MFEKLPLVRMSASWFLVSTYLIWMLGSNLILSNNQSIATLWVSGHMSHGPTSSFNSHIDRGFFVFKDVQLRFSLRRMCVGGYVIHFTQLLNLLSSFDMLGLGLGIKNCPSFLVACMFVLNLDVS